jgi:hypothetical protein
LELIRARADFGSYDRPTLRPAKTVEPEIEKHRSKARTFVRGLVYSLCVKVRAR